MRGIVFLRNLKNTNPEEFNEILEEYYGMKTRAFCTKYHIGVTGCVALFWHKKPERIIELVSQSDLEEIDVDEYRKNWMKEKKSKRTDYCIPWDIDDYYSKYSKS